MDILTFITKIVDSLAWPIAFIVTAFFLKDEIFNLLNNLRQFKYRGLHIEFEQSVKETIRQADDANLPNLEAKTGHKLLKVDKDTLLNLAKTNPKSAFFKAWIRLEDAVRLGLSNEGSMSDSEKIIVRRSSSKGACALLSREPKLLEYYDKLHMLRDQVAHGHIDSISFDTARDFIEVSFRLILYIEDRWVKSGKG